MESVPCDACSSDQTIDLPHQTQWLRLPAPYRIVRCAACRLVFMNPRMTAQEYQHFYSSQYYDDYQYDQILAKERTPKFLRRVATLSRLRPNRGRLLDIGTATGEFLKSARDDGWQVEGTEVSRYAAEQAKKVYGLSVFVGEVHEAPFSPASFDVIHMSHVLEHVPSPRQTLRTLRTLLKPDGVVVIEVPNQFTNWFDRVAAFLGRRHSLTAPSLHHVYFFTPRLLAALMQKEGFHLMVRTYSLNIPYAQLPRALHPFLRIAATFADRAGGGLFIEAFGTLAPDTQPRGEFTKK